METSSETICYPSEKRLKPLLNERRISASVEWPIRSCSSLSTFEPLNNDSLKMCFPAGIRYTKAAGRTFTHQSSLVGVTWNCRTFRQSGMALYKEHRRDTSRDPRQSLVNSIFLSTHVIRQGGVRKTSAVARVGMPSSAYFSDSRTLSVQDAEVDRRVRIRLQKTCPDVLYWTISLACILLESLSQNELFRSRSGIWSSRGPKDGWSRNEEK